MELDELIKEIDIVEYIGQYVDLEEEGDEWWGLSCFKEEKTPSFSVRENPPVFFDYSSGIGGNVFTFTKHYHKATAAEAVRILREYVGCESNNYPLSRRLQATKVAQRFSKKETTRKEKEGVVLPSDYMLRYDQDWEKLSVWEEEGMSREALEFFQVRYDKFSDRIVYPIRDSRGLIVNVCGRTLNPDWKAQGLRKYTYFFKWGVLDILYGLFENLDYIKEKREVIVFEGCKSVLLAHTWGIKNSVAILTSHLNPHQMKILARLGYRVVFALDKDVNPKDDYNINTLKNYINVDIMRDVGGLTEGKDAPVDKGLETFLKIYENKKPFR